MKTIWGETLDPNAVLQEYPRPQMVRGRYRNLNGLWDYAITDAAAPPERWDGEILVPFSPEAPLSGVGRTLLPGQTLWYRRTLAEQPREGARLLLHFGAADQEYSWAQPIPEGVFDGYDVQLIAPLDESDPVPSCRNADAPYHEGQYVVTVDGFLVSDNVTVNSATVIDTGFAYSDHNPICMSVTLLAQ